MSDTRTAEPVGVPVAPPEPLESCDRCPAHALVAVETLHGRLVFCKHHHSQHEPKLKAITLSVYDASERNN